MGVNPYESTSRYNSILKVGWKRLLADGNGIAELNEIFNLDLDPFIYQDKKVRTEDVERMGGYSQLVNTFASLGIDINLNQNQGPRLMHSQNGIQPQIEKACFRGRAISFNLYPDGSYKAYLLRIEGKKEEVWVPAVRCEFGSDPSILHLDWAIARDKGLLN